MTAPDDLTLTSAVAAGDSAAEELFAEKFRDKLVYLARKRQIPTADCDDIAHETLIAAIDQLRRGLFRGDSSIATWLERILAGKISDFWRKNADRPQSLTLDNPSPGESEKHNEVLVSPPIDPVQQLMVQETLHRMPARYRRILLLNQRDGYTTEEIGKIVGWPPGTVGRVLARAKTMFRDLVLGREESADNLRQGE